MNLIPINASHSKEINMEFNPSEEVDIDKFIQFIVDIPKGVQIYTL